MRSWKFSKSFSSVMIFRKGSSVLIPEFDSSPSRPCHDWNEAQSTVLPMNPRCGSWRTPPGQRQLTLLSHCRHCLHCRKKWKSGNDFIFFNVHKVHWMKCCHPNFSFRRILVPFYSWASLGKHLTVHQVECNFLLKYLCMDIYYRLRLLHVTVAYKILKLKHYCLIYVLIYVE